MAYLGHSIISDAIKNYNNLSLHDFITNQHTFVAEINLKDLKQKFFKSKFMGAAKVLCEYLNISNKLTIPFSISHGVDLNHQNIAMIPTLSSLFTGV